MSVEGFIPFNARAKGVFQQEVTPSSAASQLGVVQTTRKLNDRKLTGLSPALLSVYC
jgi:hypothetical protein